MYRQEAEDLLVKEISLYDPVGNVVYMPDTSSCPFRFYGIQEFHSTVSREEMEENADTVTDFCCGFIPAPGACGGNENGYADFVGFWTPEEERDETDNEIRRELAWYTERLMKTNVLHRLVAV